MNHTQAHVRVPERGTQPGRNIRTQIVRLLAGALTALAALAPAAAQAEECPNVAYRVGASANLPDCRAYEMVTPVDLNGGEPEPYDYLKSSPDGERLAYLSSAALGESKSGELFVAYTAQRSATGWASVPMSPPNPAPNQAFYGAQGIPAFSEDLSRLAVAVSATQPGSTDYDLFESGLDGSVAWLTAPTVEAKPAEKVFVGASADLSRVVFETTQTFSSEVPDGTHQVWEWSAERGIRLVSRLPNGTLFPMGATVGDGTNLVGSSANHFVGIPDQPTAVSNDGRRIFWSTPQYYFFTYHQLYVSQDGVPTQMTLSQASGHVGEQAPGGGHFAGASVNGSKAFFWSEDHLTDDATPGGGLYEYDVSDAKLSFITPGATEPGGVQIENVAQISADGSHVFFVARGILVPGKGVPGGHNLYVAHDGVVDFIATLDELDAQDWSRPNSIYGPVKTSRSTLDGRRFVFQSYRRLTGYDNQGHDEIYLWSEGDGALTCVSCSPYGAPRGDASLLANPVDKTGATSQFLDQRTQPRNLTTDGRSVFFETTDALDPRDINGTEDVYGYEEGRLVLLSSGTSPRPSELYDNTPNGSDVFITTYAALTGGDTDNGALDIYDARAKGGFPEPAPAAIPCAGQSSCRAGTFTPPGALEVGTGGSAKGGNAAVPTPRVARGFWVKARPRGMGVALRLHAPAPGVVSVTGVNASPVRRSLGHAGVYTLGVRLAAGARRRLRHAGHLTVRLTVRFRPGKGKAQTVRVHVTVNA